MLSYFLITWVVAFFVLCLPLLFITEKEKKAYRYQNWNIPKDERNFERIFSLENEKSKIIEKKNSVVESTGLLNVIFLLILPYIICATLDFSFFQILFTYIIIIIGIIGLYILLKFGILFRYFHPKSFFDVYFAVLSSPFLPAYYLTKLVLK
jgi:hypothetical protein